MRDQLEEKTTEELRLVAAEIGLDVGRRRRIVNERIAEADPTYRAEKPGWVTTMEDWFRGASNGVALGLVFFALFVGAFMLIVGIMVVDGNRVEAGVKLFDDASLFDWGWILGSSRAKFTATTIMMAYFVIEVVTAIEMSKRHQYRFSWRLLLDDLRYWLGLPWKTKDDEKREEWEPREKGISDDARSALWLVTLLIVFLSIHGVLGDELRTIDGAEAQAWYITYYKVLTEDIDTFSRVADGGLLTFALLRVAHWAILLMVTQANRIAPGILDFFDAAPTDLRNQIERQYWMEAIIQHKQRSNSNDNNLTA